MWKQLLLSVATRKLKTSGGGVWHVKIISLILRKAKHKVVPNQDITSWFSGPQPPYPYTIFTFSNVIINNSFHICGQKLSFKRPCYICWKFQM